MSRIKNWFAILKRRARADEPPARPAIEIIERHGAGPEDPQAISIFRTNERTPTESAESEETTPDLAISQGLRVIARRNPRRCPICATQGKVVANSEGGGKWKCEACGSVF